MIIFTNKLHRLLKFVWVYDSSLLNNNFLRRFSEMNCLNITYVKPNIFYNFLRVGKLKECSRVGNVITRFCAYETPSENRICWKCGKNLKDVLVFCDQCNSLQRVNSKSNYFEIIGIDFVYDLNLSEISAKYKKLQSQLHPDKFGNKTEEEKNISEEYSALVNKAYSTLINPLERGLYMLKLNGFSIEESKKEVDKIFLMEIIERNEEIENEKDTNRLKQLNLKNKESINLLIREVQEAFKENDMKKAINILTKMKYYYSIDTKIKELKQKLGIPD